MKKLTIERLKRIIKSAGFKIVCDIRTDDIYLVLETERLYNNERLIK